jgi:lipopolysaccharide export system protein LptA
MSRLFFIVNVILIISILCFSAFAAGLVEKTEKQPVVITSETLIAHNKTNTAVFEGSVVAKTDGITMSSDKMTVFYDNSESKIKKIHASGNVKVHNKERAIFANDAIYLDKEEKIIFTGNPKAVEGENVITGTQITFFLKEDRAEVEGSRVILQNTQGLK